jgi:hypothetical protein
MPLRFGHENMKARLLEKRSKVSYNAHQQVDSRSIDSNPLIFSGKKRKYG